MFPARGRALHRGRLGDGGWSGGGGAAVHGVRTEDRTAPRSQSHSGRARHYPAAPTADTGVNPSAALQLIRAETRVANDPSGIRILKQHFLRLTQHIPLERNASGMAIFTQDLARGAQTQRRCRTLEQEYIVESPASWLGRPQAARPRARI